MVIAERDSGIDVIGEVLPNEATFNTTYFDWPVQTNTSFTIENKGIYSKALMNSSYIGK
jgi:hypothetical protein